MAVAAGGLLSAFPQAYASFNHVLLKLSICTSQQNSLEDT
jgi:hypothetical protein